MKRMIAIGAMDDIHLVTMLCQSICEAMQEDSIAAKTVWRVKRRQMTEFKRSPHESRTPLRIPG